MKILQNKGVVECSSEWPMWHFVWRLAKECSDTPPHPRQHLCASVFNSKTLSYLNDSFVIVFFCVFGRSSLDRVKTDVESSDRNVSLRSAWAACVTFAYRCKIGRLWSRYRIPNHSPLDTLPGTIRGRFRQRESQRNTNMITFNLKQQHETVWLDQHTHAIVLNFVFSCTYVYAISGEKICWCTEWGKEVK